MGQLTYYFFQKNFLVEEIRYYEKMAQDTSVKVELISGDIDEGIQFWNLGGIGAILRFKIA